MRHYFFRNDKRSKYIEIFLFISLEAEWDKGIVISTKKISRYYFTITKV